MNIKGISWMGVKTTSFDAMVRLYRDVFHLQPDLEQSDFAVFHLPNGDMLELFGPGGPNEHLPPGTVICGFAVADLEQARQELVQAGIELIGDKQGGWQHFRAPDGSIFELNAPPFPSHTSATGTGSCKQRPTS